MSRARKPKLGRPSLGGKSPTARIEIKLALVDRDKWTAAAGREGLSLSEWLRAAGEMAVARGSTR